MKNWEKEFDKLKLSYGNEKKFISSLLKQQREETLREVREGFVEIAIKGQYYDSEIKGIMLYSETLRFLDKLKTKGR